MTKPRILLIPITKTKSIPRAIPVALEKSSEGFGETSPRSYESKASSRALAKRVDGTEELGEEAFWGLKRIGEELELGSSELRRSVELLEELSEEMGGDIGKDRS